MKRIFLLSALAIFILFSACKEEEAANSRIDLRMTATFGEQPLLMFEEIYDYQDQPLQLQLFQTYLANVRLTYEENGTTKEQPVADILLANFGEVFTTAEAELGLELLSRDLPARNYTGLRFGLGVSPELNTTVPSDYELTHPLAQNYWEDADSYIFFKIEGNADIDKDGQLNEKITFHVGGDNNYTEVEIIAPIDMETEGKELLLNIDLLDGLTNPDGDFINFEDFRMAHSTTSPAAVFMGDNLASGITLRLR